MEIYTSIGIFLVGIAASILGSLVGGGGLISIPFLILLGLPPQIAIATDRLGSIGQACIALRKFWQAKKILRKYVLPLSILSIGGSLLGANILLRLDTNVFQTIIGILLIVLLPFIIWKKEVGVVHHHTSTSKLVVGLIGYFCIQVLTGMFGGGTGILIFYTLIFTFGMTIVEANATQLIPVLCLYLSSLYIFSTNNLINYEAGMVLFIGMILGGYIGAQLALKKGSARVKPIFVTVVVCAAIKLLFFS